MDKDLVARLAAKGDPEYKGFKRPTIPTVKLDGLDDSPTYGQFTEWKGKDEGVVGLGTELNVRIIRTKKFLESATDKGRFYSDEYDSPKTDSIRLRFSKFQKTEGDKPELVAEGTPEAIRQAHPELKTLSAVYCITEDGRLIRLIVKGASAANDNGFYNYGKKFSGKGTDRMMFHITNITTKLIRANRAVKYYVMEFADGGENTEGLEKVEGFLDIINGSAPADETVQAQVESQVDRDFDAINQPDETEVW